MLILKPTAILPPILTATCFIFALFSVALANSPIPEQLPDPDNSVAPSKDKPVKVYILSGQSNMVGMGEIDGGGQRWGDEFVDPVVSVYEGDYDPSKNYDEIEPVQTLKLEKFGGVTPTPYPGGGVQIVRGFIYPKVTGVFEMRPGHNDSRNNIMEIDGVEVYRKEPGSDAKFKSVKLTKGEKVPFKITYLTEHANGLGWMARLDIPGNLTTLVKQQGKFPHLVDDEGNWTKREDVIYKGVISSIGQGPLKPGVSGNTIGPEMGFGHVMGYYHDEPVLLIKSSIGNRSLGWDILPPGSDRVEFEQDGKTYVYPGYQDEVRHGRWEKDNVPPAPKHDWYAGKEYDRFTDEAKNVLDNFDTLFPQFADQGYEIAGFVWWQGHKDGGDAGHIQMYEKNLKNLIKAWRKEFNAPDAPWAIATVGFGGDQMQDNYIRILEAQKVVANPEKHPEFKDTVITVDTRPFWRGVDVSPKSQDFHYNRNAETYYLVGDALGRAMVELKERKNVEN